MSLVDFLLAPRKDHRGWNTPNEASRILLIFVLVVVSYWAWPISDGMIYMSKAFDYMLSDYRVYRVWLIFK